MKKKSSYYPVALNVEGRKCVVVGGGQVSLRKVITLLEHGADVDVVSPELCTELSGLVKDGKIAARNRGFQSGDLKGSFIAVAATDDNRINEQVAKEAKASGIPVNIVDDPAGSDFIVPSSLSRGDVVIAVSTGGKSPALARKIRSKLEQDIREEYASLVELIDEVRTELKQKGLSIDSDSWQKALDLDVLIGMLKGGDRDKAKAVLLNNLKTLAE
jgi:siroheme synthase-like protein